VPGVRRHVPRDARGTAPGAYSGLSVGAPVGPLDGTSVAAVGFLVVGLTAQPLDPFILLRFVALPLHKPAFFIMSRRRGKSRWLCCAEAAEAAATFPSGSPEQQRTMAQEWRARVAKRFIVVVVF
jgi:hypothetical protein